MSYSAEPYSPEEEISSDGGGKIPKGFFPFDGSCRCSADGDLTLEFDDGSRLTTHAALISLASPILRSMLQCPADGSLRLEKTTKDAWILILNELHPESSATLSELTSVATEMLVRF